MKKEKVTTKATITKRGRPPLKNDAASSKKKTTTRLEQKTKVAKKVKASSNNENKNCCNSATESCVNDKCNKIKLKKKHRFLSTLKTASVKLVEKIKKAF